jgi:DNA-directed RNA polymerase subunit omega
MLYPSIDSLIKKTDSKYTLVVAASKRARALREGDRPELMKYRSSKYVGMALEEIFKGVIQYEKIVK